jgi:hypothetical protein
MTKRDRTTVILAALLRARVPGRPEHLARKAIELTELVEAEVARLERYDDFEAQMIVRLTSR